MGQFIIAILIVLLGAVGLYSFEHTQGVVRATEEPAAVVVAPETTVTIPSTTPNRETEATIVTSLGEGAARLGIAVTPVSVLSDSRCPVDVTCIQAGTVTVDTRIGNNWDGTEYTLTLGEPMQIGNRVIELTEVSPTRSKSISFVPSAQYVFTYDISFAPGATS